MYYREIISSSLRKNGLSQLFFYLGNLDVYRIIVLEEVLKHIRSLDNEKNNKEEKIILELGSGYSILPKMVGRPNIKYIVLDLSRDAHLYQNDTYTYPIISDMRWLPFKNSTVSVIVAISSIEHVEDDSAVFSEIGRVLKKSGVGILSYPYSSKKYEVQTLHPNRILFFIFNKFIKLWRLTLDNHHIRYFSDQISTDYMMRIYTDEYINKMLKDTGLSIRSSFKWGGDTFFKRFWSIIPPGWFILKDFMFLCVLKCVNDIQNNKNPSGIINILVKE